MKRKDFRQAYEDYHKLVLHVAFDELQDYDMAQAVCEEVFVEFYEKMERMGRRNIKGWMLESAQKKAEGFPGDICWRKDTSVTGERKRQQLAVDRLIETDEE